ncbi:MAG TPA: SRPBCC domain-containing protein [Chitinophagales bacterium]|nr:SRPBCC domain-containing protein [Chitinophagales bacterium]
MSDYDWSRFTKRININAPVEQIYKAWATQAGLESWFLSKAAFNQAERLRSKIEFAQAGDTYQWTWFGYEDATDTGKVLAANGVNTFSFSFAGECVVTVTIKTESHETIVELTQDNIPTDEKSKVSKNINCQAGWVFYLTNLKAVLESGIDLRNKDESLPNMINA